MQDKEEFNWFLDLMTKEKITSYLEIGSKYGGSLWLMAGIMEPGSKLVSVDLGHHPELQECAAALRKTHKIHLITGDSTDKSVIARVTELGPYDLLFIDGGHQKKYCESDWRAYGPLASIVAFHDIARPQPINPKKAWRMDVPLLWESLRDKYPRSAQIKHKIGLGVIWKCP